MPRQVWPALRAEDKGQYGIVISPATLPRNPLLDGSIGRTESTAESDRQQEDDEILQQNERMSFLRKLIATDRRCFVTGQPGDWLQAAQLINTLRSVPHDHTEEYLRDVKEAIEALLTRLEFNQQANFSLDARCNLMLLSTEWHAGLDLYGSFAITPPLDVIIQITRKLQECNHEWAFRYAQDSGAKRNLPYGELPLDISQLKWRILIIHSRGPCPSGRPVQAIHPSERNNHQTTVLVTWRNYTPGIVDYAPFLCESGSNIPLEIRFQTRREAHDQLSLFAVLVNAASKIKAFVSSTHHRPGDDMSHEGPLLGFNTVYDKLLEAIYFVPHPNLHNDVKLALDPSTVVTPTRTLAEPATTLPIPDRDAEHTEIGINSPPMQPESDILPGITPSEFELLLQEAHHPTNKMSRRELFGLLLYGVPGHAQHVEPPPNPLFT
ncbi:hypothetical protein MIND_01074600 [Mycena indigotica]|uniref:Uncharacterized protein n=1 Tax=Mycena indigotica TaxID=2126181 RepID=A0A8H6VXC3_9AGAR|nr:uncharacterized protein MIND_01074600 [Mycena indigotica]KAF7295351.1 hypothetical protein MIND_01074600 [Mycena indigotica]